MSAGKSAGDWMIGHHVLELDLDVSLSEQSPGTHGVGENRGLGSDISQCELKTLAEVPWWYCL